MSTDTQTTDNPFRNQPLSLDYAVETPETVVLHYQLAGPAVRLMAYTIDFVIRATITFVLMIIFTVAGLYLPGLATGLFLLWLFINGWGYYAICEGFFHGKTPGKNVLGLRVIHENGHPINFWMAINRNFIRAVDSTPLYIPALISMFCSRKFQRLGDLTAGTVVITERRVRLPREPVILEKIDPLPLNLLNQYKPDEQMLAVIGDFLSRRIAIDYKRGHELSRPLAHELARKFQFRGDPELVRKFPMAFIARVYVTFIPNEQNQAEEVAATPEPITEANIIQPAGSTEDWNE
ncbi:RDD family protein [Polystyrenella longa]|uniref:RDD family protein n=1 Tax=Polystyrenella longa TaxID=2528007 RepID=A0A518CRS3_9PLAN|nr:RDD family protein [Polystyrenella longa]QDU81913.1 RDD family protein [Polystyrenella longa]